MPASGMHSGSALSASHEPPGRNGASTSSQARHRTISASRLPVASQRVEQGEALRRYDLVHRWRLGVALGGIDMWLNTIVPTVGLGYTLKHGKADHAATGRASNWKKMERCRSMKWLLMAIAYFGHCQISCIMITEKATRELDKMYVIIFRSWKTSFLCF